MVSKEMKYGMLGDDTGTTAEKLAKYTGEVDWAYLRDHYKNGVLFFVDPELSLEEAGEVISNDGLDQVAAWLKSGDLVKIADLHALQWEGTEQRFEALVVSPFVLCRPI